MQNQDIFKEAIAEAKAVRDAAIANAKQSIEESITPHIKEMLAAKLREMEEEDEDLVEKVDDEDEEVMEEAAADEEEAEDDTEESEDDAEGEEEAEEPEEEESEVEDEELDLDTMTVDDLRDLIRDIVSQETAGMGAEDDMGMGDDMDMDMDMDMGMGDDMNMDAGVDDMVGLDEPSDDEEEIDLDELLAELDQMSKSKSKSKSITEKKAKMKEADKSKDKDKDKDKDKMKHESTITSLKSDLREALRVIKTLRTNLSEVNLLNSKLLYVNKLFKSKPLTESQKAHIIATFDKANTVREAKLLYESFTNSLVKAKAVPTQIKEHKSFASRATGHKSKKDTLNEGVISGVNDQVRRMQELAGILK